MQCKENFCSLAGLPLDFQQRIHHKSLVSQAKYENREQLNPLPVKFTICIQLECLIMPAGRLQRVLYQLHFLHI